MNSDLEKYLSFLNQIGMDYSIDNIYDDEGNLYYCVEEDNIQYIFNKHGKKINQFNNAKQKNMVK